MVNLTDEERDPIGYWRSELINTQRNLSYLILTPAERRRMERYCNECKRKIRAATKQGA